MADHLQPIPPKEEIRVSDKPKGQFRDEWVRRSDTLSVVYKLSFSDEPGTTTRKIIFTEADFEEFMDLMRMWTRRIIDKQGLIAYFD